MKRNCCLSLSRARALCPVVVANTCAALPTADVVAAAAFVSWPCRIIKTFEEKMLFTLLFFPLTTTCNRSRLLCSPSPSLSLSLSLSLPPPARCKWELCTRAAPLRPPSLATGVLAKQGALEGKGKKTEHMASIRQLNMSISPPFSLAFLLSCAR